MARRPPVNRKSTTRGFKPTAALLKDRIRRAGESRGFAVSRVLTHWAEIVGSEIASQARPVDISYGKGGFGATLTLLTTGPNAPLLEMQKEVVRQKVNATYGYAAIKRVRITQTAPVGFQEGQAQFAHAPKQTPVAPDPKIVEAAQRNAAGVADERLRTALEALGQNILSKPKR